MHNKLNYASASPYLSKVRRVSSGANRAPRVRVGERFMHISATCVSQCANGVLCVHVGVNAANGAPRARG
eukprot:8325627-Pyramimonas_sp.AAC.1